MFTLFRHFLCFIPYPIRVTSKECKSALSDQMFLIFGQMIDTGYIYKSVFYFSGEVVKTREILIDVNKVGNLCKKTTVATFTLHCSKTKENFKKTKHALCLSVVNYRSPLAGHQ